MKILTYVDASVLIYAAADKFGAEFVSAERLTKPIYRAPVNITSIY